MQPQPETHLRSSRRHKRVLQGRVAVGHPVDVASGEQFTAAHDIEVTGVSPLIFRRVYSTRFLERDPSVLGQGWVHAFEATLEKDLDGFVFEGHDGDRVEFDDVDLDFERRGSLPNPSASMELRREGERLVVYHWHDVDEPVQKYVFDARHGEHMRLVARELPSGQGIQVERDRAGRVITLTQSTERRRLYFRYGESGRLESLHLGLAHEGIEASRRVASYRYDDLGRLVSVQDAEGASRGYGYDDAGRLTLEHDRRGGTYRMAYDAVGRCIECTGADRYKQRRLIYEPGQTTRVIDGQGLETLYQYNELGQVERRIDPNGATHVTEFDDAGRVSKEIDPMGATTGYEYDAAGHLAAKTLPNGARLTYEYEEHHQPTKITEPDGAVWLLRYDRGALGDVTDPFGRHVHYVRDYQNQIIGIQSSSGQEVRVRTDDTWTEETIEDGIGLIVRRKLDLHLNPTHTEDARGPVNRSEYDKLGRLTHSQRADGSSYHLEYDPEDRITRLVDTRGAQWRARYSTYGDCLEQIDALGRAHRFAWDVEGRLSAIENPRSERARFVYDIAGNLSRIQHFDDGVEAIRYDRASRLVGRKMPDGTELTFKRDVVGNLVDVGIGDKKLRSFEYDSYGRPVRATTIESEVSIEYAVGGRIQAEVQNGRRIEYDYSPRGFLAKRTFAGSQVGPLLFEHDSRGRLRRLSTDAGPVQSFEYDGRDQCTERTLGPVTETRQYDLQGRLRHQAVGGINARGFDYDSEGALIELVDRLRGRRQYQFDPADQLLASIDDKLGSHLYQYDANGNLTAKDTEALVYDWGNRLRQLGDTVFERDANGQIVHQASVERDDRYEWDGVGQLVCVRHRDGAATRFGYDAFGRRVFKDHQPAPPQKGPSDSLAGFAWAHTPLPGEPTTPAKMRRTLLEGRTDYYWSGDELLAEVRPTGVTEYAMRGFVCDALWENGKLHHVVNSQQGVPQELVDEHGKLAWQGTFDDWGKLVAEKGSISCRLRMPGQLADDETGLHYNRFRYYSPDAGQFISPDPIAFEGGSNFYRFAPNPTNWIDPLGLYCGKDGCTKVLRAVTPEQAEAIRAGKGIDKPKPAHKTTPTQHVAGTKHSRDPWSSTTRSPASAEYFATHGGTRPANPIVEIDLAKVPGPVLDVSTPAKAAEHLQTPFTRNAAAAHQEVLIHGDIPADAIRLL
jgi:RHS repeat-associated protein